MGGHGALSLHLKHPGMYQSVSAFAGICNPTAGPWGQKAFKGYLGSADAGAEHDATLLAAKYDGPKIPILMDLGTHDQWPEVVAGTQEFKEACGKAGLPLILRMQPGYDHGYYFITTFMKDHIDFHAGNLGLRPVSAGISARF